MAYLVPRVAQHLHKSPKTGWLPWLPNSSTLMIDALWTGFWLICDCEVYSFFKERPSLSRIHVIAYGGMVMVEVGRFAL